jgi:hypothetical protein
LITETRTEPEQVNKSRETKQIAWSDRGSLKKQELTKGL